MRVKRLKACRKTMRFYRVNFNIQAPYRVLVDGTFITSALMNKIHIKEQLPKLLDGKCTTMVTNCVMAELRSLGQEAIGAVVIAKGYYRVQCQHENPINAAECVANAIGQQNKRRFLVATQDPELRRRLRTVPGCPVVTLNGQVPFLEDPSKDSKSTFSAQEEKKKQPVAWEKSQLPELSRVEKERNDRHDVSKKKRKQKGVNPLSCLKKKKKRPALTTQPAPDLQIKRKRVRSRRMCGNSGNEDDIVSEPNGLQAMSQ